MYKYIDPFTDFGFKYVFGTEKSKPYLMDFINTLLDGEPGFDTVTDVRFIDKEKNRIYKESRGVIYDILCITEDGRQFIVEMQNGSQAYFIDRSIFYMSRALFDQGCHGDWDFRLSPVFIIAFLNFKIDSLGDQLRTDALLCNMNTRQPLSDKMRFIYIQLPLFGEKNPDNCSSGFDQWIYILKNMKTMETMPFVDKRPLFRDFAQHVEYASLSPKERETYERDLKAHRDLVNQMRYATEKSKAEGKAEANAYAIRTMHGFGISTAQIAEKYNMSVDEILKILETKD